MPVCRTDRLYHYLLGGTGALPSILQRGLLPLSDMPGSERWQQQGDFYRALYSVLAEPVLGLPFRNSGIWLTPIDFRRLAGSLLARQTRIAVPVAAIDARMAVLTYDNDGQRVVQPLTASALAETARLWPAAAVSAWFGRDPSMLFFHVPQVAAYQDQGIPVAPEWVEAPS